MRFPYLKLACPNSMEIFMADTDSVSRKEFDAYKAQVQDKIFSVAGELEKLKKEVGGLRSQLGNLASKKL
jgi:hypothetical protein